MALPLLPAHKQVGSAVSLKCLDFSRLLKKIADL